MKLKRLFLLPVLVFAGALYAHAPKNIVLEFRSVKKSLTITLDHPVAEPSVHFIEKLEIQVNGATQEMPAFTWQHSKTHQVATISLEKLLADTSKISLTITATCNQAGEIHETVTLKSGYNVLKSIGMSVQWQIQDKNLAMSIQAPTTGWVAVGFEPEKMMKGANFIIGYVKNSTAFIRDDFGTGRIRHKADTDIGGQNNILAFNGSETDTASELSFVIPLNSGDTSDKPLTPGTIHTILLAYGKKDSFNAKHCRDDTHQIKL